MKTIYFLSYLLVFTWLSLNAQFVDDMESYTEGQPISGAHWTDWGCGGGVGCAIMSSPEEARSGSLSGLIPGDTTTDAILDLGNKISGTWTLIYYMYIPEDKEAYQGIMDCVPICANDWYFGIFFNEENINPGIGRIDWGTTDSADDTYFDFPHDQWFEIIIFADIVGIENITWKYIVNNTVVVPCGTPLVFANGINAISLGGLNFYSISEDAQFYLDDFYYTDEWSDCVMIGNIEENENEYFIAYPNPIKDVLNLRANDNISDITIYNLLGKEVYSANINISQTTIDISCFENGVYFVKAKIGDFEKTIKVIK